MRVVLDAAVSVFYSQMYLESYEDHPAGRMEACFAGQRNGLAGAAVPGGVFLVTGLHTGDVGLRVEVHRRAPTVDDAWEDVVEVAFRPGSLPPALSGWGGEWVAPLPLDSGPYRLRWCASGMDAGRDVEISVDGPVVDRYLLQLWPALPAPDAVVRETSATAALAHAERRAQRE